MGAPYKDGLWDHTYSITSSYSFRKTLECNKTPPIFLKRNHMHNQYNVIKTEEVTSDTLKIRIATNFKKKKASPFVPNGDLHNCDHTNSEEAEKSSSKPSSKAPLDSVEIKNENHIQTRSQSRSGRVRNKFITVEASDFCAVCQNELTSSLANSVFCLKTGNINFTCSHCSTDMCIKRALRFSLL